MGRYTIAVLPGDGIGPEVVDAALLVLHRIGELFGHTFIERTALVGEAALSAEGAPLSQATIDLCAASDGILFGAVGGTQESERRPIDQQAGRAITGLRRAFDLFANIRPMRPFPELSDASPVRADRLRDVDFVLVRELTGGLYFGEPRGITVNVDGTRQAVDTLVYTEAEIARVVRAAARIARNRRGQLTSIDKANVLHTSRLWREVTEQIIATEFPEVRLRHILVDACAMELIRNPAQFDVLVTENTFGDILTDEAATLSGSIGLLPSASLGTRQTAYGTFGLFEPIHGTAPDITGQGIANPVATILSAAMLLRLGLGLANEADAVESAVARAIAAGARTADIRGRQPDPPAPTPSGDGAPGQPTGPLTTAEMTAAILSNLV